MPLRYRLLIAALLLGSSTALAQDIDCPVEKIVNVTIQSSPRPSLPGQGVKFDVFVEPLQSPLEPAGSVTLSDDITDLGTVALVHGQASFTRSFNSAAVHIIRALYNPDYFYCPAVGNFNQLVDRLTPTIALSLSAANAPYGALLSLTATITPAPPNGVSAPAGPVQFFDNGTLIGAADLVNGKASFSTSALAPGTHQITATLIGDPNWYSVRTSPQAVTVTSAPTTTLLNASATASEVTFSVNVNSAGVVPQTGTLRIVDTTNNNTLATTTLPTVSVTLPIAKVPVGHAIAAIYSEGPSFTPSTSNTLSLAAILNAAGAISPNIAPDEIVSLYGAGFSTATIQGTGTQLPTTLGGVTIDLANKTGTVHAPLYLVSPTQINFLIPAGLPPGPITLTVTGAAVIPMQLTVAAVAPGIFNPGSQILRVAPDGSQTVETVGSAPITIGSDPTYLVLYCTGLRNRSSLSAVTASVGNLTLPVVYAGPQNQFPGLDQVDLALPASLKSAGRVNVSLTVDSQATNAISLQFQ